MDASFVGRLSGLRNSKPFSRPQRPMNAPRKVILLVAMSLLMAGCGVTTKSPVPTTPAASAAAVAPIPSPEPAVLTLRLWKCPVLTGCGAYGSVTRVGGPAGEEVLLEGAGEPEAKGLPESLAPGSYVVRFRFVTLSDEVLDGQMQELPYAACETQLRVTGDYLGEQIDVVVAFADGTCVVTQGSRIART
jgi:hypothetical protein